MLERERAVRQKRVRVDAGNPVTLANTKDRGFRMTCSPAARLAIVAVTCLVALACDSKGSPIVPAPAPASLSISPSTAVVLDVGTQITVVATVQNLTPATVTYHSSFPAVATVHQTTGLVSCVAPGTATVTVVATADPNLRASVGVSCTAPPPPPSPSSTTYAVTITVASDPFNHNGFVQFGTVRSIVCARSGSTLTASGSPPFVSLTGPIDANGTFKLTGSGTVAGYPNVNVVWDGAAQGNSITGRIVVGAGGGLPNGPIEYNVTGTVQ
jgi:hypothetical protein